MKVAKPCRLAINNGSLNPMRPTNNANGIKVADVEINDWSINEGISTGRTMSFAQVLFIQVTLV